jgi:hypothetical protein
MAKKPVKKVTKPAATKKVVAAKKTAPAKKPAAVVAASAPVVSCSCSKGCGCFKKFVIFLLGAAVGAFACCHFVCGKDMGPMGFLMKRGPRFENRFVNGCLDTSKIGCPERLEKIQLKDADKNGCITEEELKADAPAPQAPADAPRKLRMHR